MSNEEYITGKVHTTYRVDLPMGDYDDLIEYENDIFDGAKCLYGYLEMNTAAFDTDDSCSNHFGDTIYFTLADKDDTPEEHEKIMAIIKEYVLRAKIAF